jgi:hypothetical protein
MFDLLKNTTAKQTKFDSIGKHKVELLIFSASGGCDSSEPRRY